MPLGFASITFKELCKVYRGRGVEDVTTPAAFVFAGCACSAASFLATTSTTAATRLRKTAEAGEG